MLYWWIWIILALVLIIIEIFTPQFDTLYFSIGCFVAAAGDVLGFPLIMQILLFAITIIIVLFIFRGLVAKTLYKSKEEIETNIYALKGKTGLVTETIDNLKFKGRVKIGGEYWKAQSLNNQIINEGSTVQVLKVEGSKVVVKPK